LGDDTQVYLKLELFQRTGTFKAREAINNVLAIPIEDRVKGITAMSAGNHAIAAAYAAKCIGVHAKVVMQASANPARVQAARALGAELVMAEDGLTGFAMVEDIVRKEGRTFIHPFEGKNVTEATATVGLEIHEDLADIDAVVVPIGGGGLCSGVGTVTRLLNPDCKVYGVEPEGAAVMKASLEAGSAQQIDKINTIADSLAPPMTLPYSFSMVQSSLDELVLVGDDDMAAAAAILFDHMKLAVEPAGAATTAAAFGPLKEKLKGKRVVLIVCGSNTNVDGLSQLIHRGHEALMSGVLP
jgi:threonine dehydratase